MCDTIKEIEAFCEGYCGTRINPEYPECVEGEINKRFSALKARIAELEEVALQRIVEVGELQTALGRIAEIEPMLAAKDEALETHRDAVWGDTPVAHNADVDLYKALALTPADTVDMVRKKDDVAQKLYTALADLYRVSRTEDDKDYFANLNAARAMDAYEKQIEAARAAGVGISAINSREYARQILSDRAKAIEASVLSHDLQIMIEDKHNKEANQ